MNAFASAWLAWLLWDLHTSLHAIPYSHHLPPIALGVVQTQVFLGLGLPWTIGAIYWTAMGGLSMVQLILS